jgi:hypothetical protein
VLEDWIWHVTLPMVAYALLTVSGVLLDRHETWAPFGVATAVLLLVFIGIHNAWDTVTYVALMRTAPPSPPADDKQNADTKA